MNGRPLSPGVVFGCVELLGVVSRNSLTPGGVLSLSLGSVSPRDILDAAVDLRWLVVSGNGLLEIAPRGKSALSVPDDQMRLRQLILDYIDVQNPPWLQLASAGRRELLLQAPSGTRQVQVEAGLAYGGDPDTASFWDTLAARARGMRSALLTETGRVGERLSIAHEKARTGREPRWIALDSNVDGYDVLSHVSSEDQRRLTIEVKASTQAHLSGVFHLTRNEWSLAEESVNQESVNHVFHLWNLGMIGRNWKCFLLRNLRYTFLATVAMERGSRREYHSCPSYRFLMVVTPFSS